MNSGHLSVRALAILVAAVLIVDTDAHTRWCYCDIRYSTTYVPAGSSVDNLPIVTSLPSISYQHWLSVSCRRVLDNCPDDCRNQAELWLGSGSRSSQFRQSSGSNACSAVKRNMPPGDGVYVYFTHRPSSCNRSGHDRSSNYISRLCCWKSERSGYSPTYVYNHECRQRSPPN